MTKLKCCNDNSPDNKVFSFDIINKSNLDYKLNYLYSDYKDIKFYIDGMTKSKN